MKSIALILSFIVPLMVPSPVATASQPISVHIETEKPFGFLPGTFSAAGGISDSGVFENLSRTVSGIGAPGFLISHIVLEFEGALGTFVVRAEIKETVTDDPNVLTNEGSWVILGGTGAYETLRGQGRLTGTADHNTGVISRTYTGNVHVE